MTYDWPGWRLKDNPFGKDFDLVARKRMVNGGRLLLPLIKKYEMDLGSSGLEIGPFFNPLITPRLFKGRKIYYLDNDLFALHYLKNLSNGTYILSRDLNKDRWNINRKFDFIVVSQVFNYVDYKKLLKAIRASLKDDGYIFINNVPNYGIPVLFSKKRPKNSVEIIWTMSRLGFKILEQRRASSTNRRIQKEDRLLLVAQKGIS